MYRNILLAFIAVAAINSVSYAQDVTRSLSMYICGGTGNINPGTDAILDHWGEAGLTFSQNFAEVQWLTFSATLAICTAAQPLTHGTDQNGDDVWTHNGPQEGSYTGAYMDVDLGFAGYFNLGFKSTGMVEFDVNYPIALPANQTIKFFAGLEVLPLGKVFYDTARGGGGTPPQVHTDTAIKGHFVDFMQVGMSYGVQFHPEWSFGTDLSFRFSGATPRDANYAPIVGAEPDSMETLKNSFYVRWNNKIAYNNPNGFGGYFQLRYEPTNIMEVANAAGIAEVQHNVKLMAGVTYAFDLSAL